MNIKHVIFSILQQIQFCYDIFIVSLKPIQFNVNKKTLSNIFTIDMRIVIIYCNKKFHSNIYTLMHFRLNLSG